MTASESAEPPAQEDAEEGPSTFQRMLHAMDPRVVLSRAGGSSVLRLCLMLCYPVWVVLVLAAMAVYYGLLAVLVLAYLLWKAVALIAKGLLIAVYVVGWVVSWPIRAVLPKQPAAASEDAQGEAEDAPG